MWAVLCGPRLSFLGGWVRVVFLTLRASCREHFLWSSRQTGTDFFAAAVWGFLPRLNFSVAALGFLAMVRFLVFVLVVLTQRREIWTFLMAWAIFTDRRITFCFLVAMDLFCHHRLKVFLPFLLQVPDPPMPPAVFARVGDMRHPVLTRSAVPANEMYLGDRPQVQLRNRQYS